MNRDERTPEEMLDQVIDSIRAEHIDAQTLDAARRRAWDRIVHAAEHPAEAAPARITSCSDFQALLPEYVAGTLAEGRRMLVEDHTHECVACRRALHQFSQPSPARILQLPSKPPTPSWRKYAIAASLLVTAGLAGWRAYETFGPAPAGSRAIVLAASGAVLRIGSGVIQPVAAGAEIAETDVVRTLPGAQLMLRLRDGSQVEVGERAEFEVSMNRSDTTLRLDRGTVIVQAAKRGSGHLYVTSADCRVAVTGTVFAVNRGMKGSRVSVVEGSVEVEHGGREVTLKPGDQVSTDASMESVPIQDEIAWSRNLKEHLVLLNVIANLKSKLDAIPMPGVRYGSRLLEFVPADTVVFASVPNVGQTLSEAHRMFEEQVRLSPVLQQWTQQGGKDSQEHTRLAIDTVRRFSEYIGDEIIIAVSARSGSRNHNPVVLAEVHRAGLREFLATELAKLKSENSGVPFNVIDASAPIPASGMSVVLRGNYVFAGSDSRALEEVARNVAGSSSKVFAAGEFGRHLSAKMRGGTGILIGFDLQRLGAFHTAGGADQQAQPGTPSGTAPTLHARSGPVPSRDEIRLLGADGAKFLIAEQKEVGGETQRSANLTFAGARTGIASWLASPAPIGGLAFVSPDAQFVATALLKKPEQLVDEFLALKSDASKIFEEARKHLNIDIKRDVAATLGGEVTIAVDGPLVPTVSWKVALDVTNPVLLQQTIEKVVNAANLVVQLAGQKGYQLETETRNDGGLLGQSGPVTYHVIRALDPSPFPEIHYVYSGGYLLAAPNRGLLTKAMQSRQAGVTLARSERFRRLLPRDGHTNFSGVVYQNAGQWLGAIANSVGSEEQRAAGEVAAKVGPMLVAAYGDTDRIELVNKGSAWDIVLQSVLQPLLNRGTRTDPGSYR